MPEDPAPKSTEDKTDSAGPVISIVERVDSKDTLELPIIVGDTSSLASPEDKDCWTLALKALDKADQIRLEELLVDQRDHVAVLSEIVSTATARKDERVGKRSWVIGRGDRAVDLRALYGKIAFWVSKFREIGDCAVQYDPGHAVLPWAAVRFVLQVTAQSFEALGSALQTLETSTRIIARSAIVEHLYLMDLSIPIRDSDMEVQWPQAIRLLRESLVKLYAEVLSQLAKVLHYFRQGSAKHVWSSLISISDAKKSQVLALQALQEQVDRQISLVEGIKSALSNRIVAEMNTDVQQALRQERNDLTGREETLKGLFAELQEPINRLGSQMQDLQDHMQLDLRLKLLSSISDLPFRNHHDVARHLRLPTSGTWLLDHPIFKDWHSSETPSVLWLAGIPGSGKTKLASLVIDQLREEKSHVVHFYCVCNTAETRRGQVEEVLRSLIRQLACVGAQGAILDPIRSRFQDAIDGLESIDSFFWSREEATKILADLTGEYETLYIVVDALDEMDEDNRLDLLDSLKQVLESCTTTVKLFFSSRDSVNVAATFEECLRIRVTSEQNEGDIAVFVGDLLEKMTKTRKILKGRVPAELDAEIREWVVGKADGMFRWAELQMDSLKSHISARQIRTQLTKLPDSLDKSYRQVLDPMLTSEDESDKLAIFTLQFLVCAKALVNIEDYLDFASFSCSEVDFDSTATLEDSYDEETLLDACSNLVHTEDEAPRVLRFPHFSVRECLDRLHSSDVTLFTTQETSERIASACLAYLRWALSDKTSTDPEPKSDVFSPPEPRDYHERLFLRYATRFALAHVEDACAAMVTPEQLLAEVDATFAGSSDEWLRYLEVHDNRNLGASASLLTLACSQGLVRLAGILIDRGAPVNGAGKNATPPLTSIMQAIWIKDPEPMVEMLLARGADVMAKDVHQRIALQYAVEFNRFGAARQLLSSKTVSPREQLLSEDEWLEIALHKAANSNSRFIPLLLGYGHSREQLSAEVGKRFAYRRGTVFRCAAMYGQPESFLALSSHDPELSRSLLQASWAHHQKIMHEVVCGSWGANSFEGTRPNIKLRLAKLALEFSVEVDPQDDDGKTPLSMVEKRPPFKALALLLVARGADPETRDKAGVVAINAVDAINMDCRELLAQSLEHDPTRVFESSGAGQSSLLHLACQLGRAESVGELLQRDAPVSAVDANGSTPLHLSAFGGHQLICQDLLSKGADPKAIDKDGLSPVDMAVIGDHSAVLKLLLMHRNADGKTAAAFDVNAAAKMEMNRKDSLAAKQSFQIPDWRLENNHDIIYHARNNNAEGVRTILARKLCSIEHVDPRWHKTALHWTAETGYSDIVQLLVDNGANTAARDDFSNLPLHYATEHGYLETSKVLVAAGSPLNGVDGWGRTPLQAAQKNGQDTVSDWLQKEIAKSNDHDLKVRQAAQEGPSMWTRSND